MTRTEAGTASTTAPDWRRWLTPGALLLVSLAALLAVFWGRFFADPGIEVFEFDAGPVAGLAIGDVRPFLDLDLYLVGLEDGRLRAIDGRVRSSGCVVEWRPDDPRAVAANPLGRRGAFVDPCTGATWALSGNQVQSAGTPEPLRTFAFVFATQPDGAQHVFIEVIGRPASTPEG